MRHLVIIAMFFIPIISIAKSDLECRTSAFEKLRFGLFDYKPQEEPSKGGRLFIDQLDYVMEELRRNPSKTNLSEFDSFLKDASEEIRVSKIKSEYIKCLLEKSDSVEDKKLPTNTQCGQKLAICQEQMRYFQEQRSAVYNSLSRDLKAIAERVMKREEIKPKDVLEK